MFVCIWGMQNVGEQSRGKISCKVNSILFRASSILDRLNQHWNNFHFNKHWNSFNLNRDLLENGDQEPVIDRAVIWFGHLLENLN